MATELARLALAALFTAVACTGVALGAQPEDKPALRCGWFENPTPGNAWLTDREAKWIVGIQGEHQAEGDWPEFSSREWVAANRSHGYGCACLRVVVDQGTHEVRRILSATSRPLAVCRGDPALKEPGRQWRRPPARLIVRQPGWKAASPGQCSPTAVHTNGDDP
jgi:hypothetical protein